MIGFYKKLKMFRKFVIKELDIKTNCKLRLLPKHNVVHFKDDIGFACIILDEKHKKVIFLPIRYKNEPDALYCICYHLAHEYAHLKQYETNKDLNEEEANEMAEKLMDKYLMKFFIRK